MLPSHPLPDMFETPDEKLVREEGEMNVDMYAKGTDRWELGMAMLRVVRAAAQHRMKADAAIESTNPK